MLSSLGTNIDHVVVCEIDPLRALFRVMERDTRTDEPENIETSINRASFYHDQLATFTDKLGG